MPFSCWEKHVSHCVSVVSSEFPKATTTGTASSHFQPLSLTCRVSLHTYAICFSFNGPVTVENRSLIKCLIDRKSRGGAALKIEQATSSSISESWWIWDGTWFFLFLQSFSVKLAMQHLLEAGNVKLLKCLHNLYRGKCPEVTLHHRTPCRSTA